MKLNSCKYPIDFIGFTVQPGMIFGYDQDNKPFVSNGKLQAGNVLIVYRLSAPLYDGTRIWQKTRLLSDTRLFGAIRSRTLKEGGVSYLNSAQLECERWTKREIKDGIFYQGYKSRHYGFSMTRK